MRRIVVTGLGAVTPLASGVEASWSRLLAGRSGIRRLPDDMVADLPATVDGVVPSLEEDPDAGFDPDAVLAPKDQRKVDRFILFALAAAEEALAQAKWKPVSEMDRLLGAAGGLGAIFAILALGDQVAPPTLNLSAPDPAGDGIDFVANQARPLAMDYAICNGFGFGGVNASALFRRWTDELTGRSAGGAHD